MKDKKTNKKIYMKFVLMVVIGCVGGAIIGFCGALISDLYGGDIVGGLHQIFKVVIPVVYVLVMMVSYGYSFYHYNKAKKMFTTWDGVDENVLDHADEILGLAMIPNIIMQVCNFFLYSAMIYISGVTIPDIGSDGMKQGLPMLATAVGLFIFNMVVITMIQKLTVDLTKKLNPEKNGNIFDKEFNKDWLASCDEAEKLRIYEASHKAFQATQMACLMMWMFSLMGMLLFDIGIMPSVCVFVIWLTLTVSYCTACRKKG